MAEIPPHMPRREEILARAVELFMFDHPGAPTPEEYELREANYWERARLDIMTGIRSQLEEYLASLESEAETVREELGIEKPPPPPERMMELEAEVAGLERRNIEAKRRLREAREEIERLRELKPPPPPPPPPPPVGGLGPDEKRRLEDIFRRTFTEAGIPRLPAGAISAFRDELATLQEDLKEVPRERAFSLARRRIEDLALTFIPVRPPPPPPIAPPPVVAPPVPPVYVPPAELLGPRRRVLVVRDCWGPGPPHTFEADRDLERRVRLVPVHKAFTPALGARYEPLLRFPPLFYQLCPEHRYEKYGYRDVYDVLGYNLAETKSSRAKRLTITKETLQEIGLTIEDLRIIQARASRWLGQGSQLSP